MRTRPPATDETWLRAAALRGDEAAWTALYEPSFGAVWASALKHVGGARSLAEEVVQEAWMTAVKKLRRFDPAKGSFEAWVCGIARQHARNARRARLRRELRERPLGEELVHEVRLATSGALASESLERVWSALPDRDRDVLRARYEQHLSIEEIASAHRASEKAIESRLGRARERFRKLWQREDSR